MRFWDSSAIVPLVVGEPDTERREAQLGEDGDIVTWWAARVECASALARLVRSGDMSEAQQRVALRDLGELADSWTEVLPTDRVRTMALRLLRVHPLRAADALQLAACLVASDGDPGSLTFVCADARLRDAADKEGLIVLS